MFVHAKLYLPLAAVGLSLFACSASGDREQVAQSAIIGGGADSTHTSVVMLVHNPGEKDSQSCTATAITPHVLVTAAHCVHPSVIGTPKSSLLFLGSDARAKAQIDDPKNWVAVQSMHPHPKYTDAQHLGNDIGVIVTKEAMSIPTTKMSLKDIPDDALPVVGVAVGYGLTSASDAQSAGMRTSKDAKITSRGADDLWRVQNGLLCHGDSGGALLTTENGHDRLTGVHAFVSTETCNGANYSTRVAVYAESFIAPFAEEADPGYLARPDPEPTVDAGTTVDASAPPVSKVDAGSPAVSAPAAESGCGIHPGAPNTRSSRSGLWLLAVAMSAYVFAKRKAS